MCSGRPQLSRAPSDCFVGVYQGLRALGLFLFDFCYASVALSVTFAEHIQRCRSDVSSVSWFSSCFAFVLRALCGRFQLFCVSQVDSFDYIQHDDGHGWLVLGYFQC